MENNVFLYLFSVCERRTNETREATASRSPSRLVVAARFHVNIYTFT